MLEGLVTWVLNNYVGEYLENLNADQISIALLQGQVELENVPLKKSALRKLDVPLEVRSGIIGKLTLTVPIARIRSEPWVLQMSDLLVLLGPNTQPAGGLDLVEEGEQLRKEHMFDELEKAHKQRLMQAAMLHNPEDTQNAWWGASLVSAVSNNIQLILNNVHIRYEDSTTLPGGHPFQFGFRIHQISIQTTNSQWKPGFVQPEDNANSFKKLDVKGFSVFWNCEQPVHGQVGSYEELKRILAPETTKNNTYILKPFSMAVRLEKNGSKLPLKTMPAIPRFKFDLRPETIEIELSKKQLAQIRMLTTDWSRFDRARQHRKWRPLVQVEGHAKQWWDFAMGRVVEDNRKQRATASRDFIVQRVRLLNNYCRAYQRKLRAFVADQEALQAKAKDPNAKVAPASAACAEDAAYMKQIEHDSAFTYNELHLFRETVFRKYVRELDKAAAGEPTKDDEPFEVFEVVSPESEPSRSQSHGALSHEASVEPSASMSRSFHEGSVDAHHGGTNNNDDAPGVSRAAEPQPGLYGWLASWFGGADAASAASKEEDAVNPAALLDMWPRVEQRDLPPNLRKVEKRIEEELLDVLSESWDDSTVLRRDSLLAELVLQLERMLVRFVDDDELTTHGLSRVLALDLSGVASRVLLSPREHRTEISLSVQDMSVQRLRIAPHHASAMHKQPPPLQRHDSAEDSLWETVGLAGLDTEVLFAVGKTTDKSSQNDHKDEKHQPLLQLFYRRLAPRLNIFHEITASFLPLTVVYDEDALDGLAQLFDTRAALKASACAAASPDVDAKMSADSADFEPDAQLFMTVHVPEVMVELRSKRRGPATPPTPSAASAPFASARLAALRLGVARTQHHLTRLQLGFDHFELVDRFEPAPHHAATLLRTVPPAHLVSAPKSMSRSCPTLADSDDQTATYSSSLPTELKGITTYVAQRTAPAPSADPHPCAPSPATAAPKRAELGLDNDFGRWEQCCVLLTLVFVHPKHARFADEHHKQHCTVRASLGEVEFGVNRRAWTMLLNFFGVLGRKTETAPATPTAPKSPHAKTSPDPLLEALLYGKKLSEVEAAKLQAPLPDTPPPPPYHLRVQLEFAQLRCHMNYPAHGSQLGRMLAQGLDLDLLLNTNNPAEPMSLTLKLADFALTDQTPFYSRLYGERLLLKRNADADSDHKLEVRVEKHRTDDPDLKRKYDIKVDVVGPDSMQLLYTHTHRYFCAFLDFWCNFAELQDQVRRKNEKIADSGETQKTRCLLSVDLNMPCTLLLPLNQFSEQLIVLETEAIRIKNKFMLGSQTTFLEQHAIESLRTDDEYDCLLDQMSMQCERVRVFEGRRSEAPPPHPNRTVGWQIFQEMHVDIVSTNVLSRPFQLDVEVFRNLSSFISHNLPELSIITHFADVELYFRTEFYRLLRGFLEKNLGEHLLIQPDKIPLEVLQSPDKGVTTATSIKYACFSNRMDFRNVVFHFLMPQPGSSAPTTDTDKFGRVVLHKARISFDSYIDNQSELDIICESSELIDTRFEDCATNKRPNIFTTIVAPSRKAVRLSSGTTLRLMSEAHIMMRKDEPPVVTLVLMNSRVLLILDWLNQAKDFILANTDFVPPEEPSSRIRIPFAAPKSGVLVRDAQPALSSTPPPVAPPPHTITLKITLKESDLVLLERASEPNSLALVAHITAVLALNDQCGVLEGHFEVQNMSLSWCLMSAEASTVCQMTNEFDLTAVLTKDPSSFKQNRRKHSNGLDILDACGPRQNLRFEVGELIARLSYKDALVVRAVVQGAMQRLHQHRTTPQRTHSQKGARSSVRKKADKAKAERRDSSNVRPAPVHVKSIALSGSSLSLWLLDDSQGVALPLIRFVCTDLQLTHANDKLEMRFVLGTDYFNQRVFGWEPLIEPWQVDALQMQLAGAQQLIRVQPAIRSPLNLNLTQTFVQQAKHFSTKWHAIKQALDTDLRTQCVRSRSDHLPYLLRNEVGADLIFTTAVDEIAKARKEQRKPTAKWFTALADKEVTFEFPTKALTVRDRPQDQRSLVIRVDGWHEISPVSVDSVGTYFRVAKRATTAAKSAGLSPNSSSSSSSSTTTARTPEQESERRNDEDPKPDQQQPQQQQQLARIVVAVSMEPDGRKVVTVRSALHIQNNLADPVLLAFHQHRAHFERRLRPGDRFFAPLHYVDARLIVRPLADQPMDKSAELKWRWAQQPGEVANKLVCFSKPEDERQYWMCVCVKRENYPEDQPLCGHSIYLLPTLNVLNLLPTDVEFRCNEDTDTVLAGQRLQSAAVNLDNTIHISLATDKFRMQKPVSIHRSKLSERQFGSESSRILMRFYDAKQRELHVYASVNVIRGGAVHVSLWVPFWIINRSGIPLVLKQEAADDEAAGQLAEHENAKDRNPMMFSFSDPDCPNQCVVRIGNDFQKGFKPRFSRRFALVPGVQALQLTLTHEKEATQIYNIGVEVRQGTGRYKDTQVVMFAPRYRLNNLSSGEIVVVHPDELNQNSKHVRLAPRSNLIWHETFEDNRSLCARLIELPYWSCPFRIDQVGSFHVTMRDRDETPRFVRVEVTLLSASFWVTFTDAHFLPPPIQIENCSNVPVLYHQHLDASRQHHLRTICKAQSVVEYSWDDLYAAKLLTLQVYENKSHTYEPAKPSQGPPLIYENHVYIQYAPSFKREHVDSTPTNLEEQDLVFAVRKEGKVQLSRQNLSDSSQAQLWSLSAENCLENVGFNHRHSDANVRHVLDVLENGSVLMMRKRDPQRNATQRWRFTNDGRLRCGLLDRYVEVRGTALHLSAQQDQAPDVPANQRLRKQRQKPGSGVLDVQCLHVGPTLVVRITDRADKNLEVPSRQSSTPNQSAGLNKRTRRPSTPTHRNRRKSEVDFDAPVSTRKRALEARIEIPAGFGISLVNNRNEELIYALFKDLELTMIHTDDGTYRLTGAVQVIQADNQLLTAERWPLLYCEANALKLDGDTPDLEPRPGAPRLVRPALKLEMSCKPHEHYDALDCFRLKLCDMCVLLDEQLLWRVAQFVQETGTAESVKPRTLLQPPDIEPAQQAGGGGARHAPRARRCYFGTLELEIGSLALTVCTVAKNGLPRELRPLRDQFNVKLVSFENALVALPAFRQFHYFETVNFLVESLSKFYMAEFQKQTMKVIVTMDAFGNPQGLASDLKESFQGLLFEGDVSGFVSGLGYGVSNSLSKMASSVAHGVGSLTFDEQHELMRQRMLRSQSQAESSTALSHLYGGVKGLGVGVFGGLTALAKNTLTATQEDGISGIFRGVTTGAVDTFTKPVQGVFDLIEGTASAVKEVVGGPSVRKSHFPERRIRMPRVGTSLQSLLPRFDDELADAQQELLRINGFSTSEVLLDVVLFLSHIWGGDKEVQRAIICSEQCYILKQVNDQPVSVTQRIAYRYLRNVQPVVHDKSGLVKVEIAYEESRRRGVASPAFVWCSDRDVAARLADRVLQAKQRYDHSKRTLTVAEDLVECL